MHLSGEVRRTLTRLVLEVVVYSILVIAYLFLLFHFFGPELVALSKRDLVLYSGLALGLMVVQGIFLESVTTFLLDRLNL